MRSLAARAVILAAVGVFMAWPVVSSARAAEPDVAEPDAAQPAPAQPPATTAQPSPQDIAARKIEKLFYSVRDKMNDFQKEEFQLEIASIKLQAVKNPKNVIPTAYRDAVLVAAHEWFDLQQRYSGIGRTVKTLEKDRANAPANLQADIDAIGAKFEQKNRFLQLKVVELYEMAADYRDALAACTAFYRDIPEDKRAAALDLKMQIADLCAKTGDNAGALAAYKSILDSKPEADRYKDANFCEKLGDVYEATGDLKNAIDIYKRALAAPEGAKGGRGAKKGKAALQKKIDDLEKKLNPPAPAAKDRG